MLAPVSIASTTTPRARNSWRKAGGTNIIRLPQPSSNICTPAAITGARLVSDISANVATGQFRVSCGNTRIAPS